MAIRPRALAGALLILLASLLPSESLAGLLTHGTLEQRLLAVSILRICVALNGVALLVRVLLPPGVFRSSGLPASASGLLLGPRGWAPDRPRVAWRALMAILAAGTLLRLVGLGTDLWLDEIATVVNYLRLPVWEVVQSYTSPNQHLLYSVVARLSVGLFGESAWAARAPALLFGVGGLAALYFLARVVAPQREALAATALLAVSYHHVWFSQSARGYTAMIFWTLLGTGLFLRALARNRGAAWTAYVAAMSLAVLSHQTSAFVLLGHAATYLLALPRWPEWRREHGPLTRRILWSLLMVTLLSVEGHSLVLPQVVTFFRTADRTGLGWTDLASFLPVLARGLTTGLGAAGLLAFLVLLAPGAIRYWRQSRLVAGLMVLPVALHGIALVTVRYGAYPRSFLYVLPLALLVAVRGAVVLGEGLPRHLPGPWRAIAQRSLGPGLIVLMLVASSAALTLNYRHPKQDYTGALAWVMAHKAPGDEVAAVGLAGVSYRHYYAPHLRFPESPAELAALRGPGRTTWVLFSFPRDMRLRFPALLDYVETELRIVATFPGTLGDGTLYVARSTGGS